MKLKLLLSIASVYMALIGLGMIFVPRQFGIGAVPVDASSELIAFLRIFGGPCLGIAVLDWIARDAEPSTALNAIILGNLIGFACVAANDVVGVVSGGARPIAKLFLVIHLAMAVAFAFQWQGRERLSAVQQR